jgi:ABC-2 type transport system permease protein
VRAFSIALKDLRRAFRSPAGLAMMLVAPLLLAFVLGSAFGSGDNFSIATVKTVVADLDEGAGAGMPAAGATLTGVLQSERLSDLLDVSLVTSAEAARAAVDSGQAYVAVIIPADMSRALAANDSAAAASVPAVQIYKDPARSVGPAIVKAVVESVVQNLNGAQATAAAAAFLGASHGVTDPEKLAALASAAAQAFALRAQQAAPSTLQQRSPVVDPAKDQASPNVASQVLVGMMLFFMLFGAATPARTILDEHRDGTLPRLFTTPTPRSVILGGKYLSVLLVVLAQVAVLLVAGRLLLGARWGEVGPVIILALCSALVATSLGLLTVSFAKTPAQAGAVGSAVFVFLGLISGNFTGTIGLSGAYAVVRRVSPLGWLMEGWSSLLYGGSWVDIWLPAVVSFGFALAFLGVATFFFRRRYA